ncbi:DUF1631 domain-containing protein [Paucibacter sp. Y2R2-4]|uniref:DUF1631 domain-containing protein n=1 Tax=Paucibacter sp. Y2R2-4 TaxID=2893553 RepID=UPI0021E4DC1B|nr:DUF1631 domain-containing protein [Paucibacter sp. Y2R2-4]MCV2349369.1 DUF1631 domain-containing protein [Paucibacter sp. Y2R2-4]
MNSPEPKLNPHLDAAVQRIRTAAEQAAERCAEGLGLSALSAGQAKRRDALLAAQFLFRKQQAQFGQQFHQHLREQLVQEQAGKTPETAGAKKKDWGELSLMEDEQVDALVVADRIGLAIGHQSEWELREVESYIFGLSSGERNPLRPELIGQALLAAVHAVSEEAETRQILIDELTRALAQEMRACYADIAELFRNRGLRPQDLRVRAHDSAAGSHGYSTRSQSLSGNSSHSGHSMAAELSEGAAGGARYGGPHGSSHGGSHGASSNWGGLQGASQGPRGFGGQGQASSGGMGAVDAQLMDLLRRLAHQAPSPGHATPAMPAAGFGPAGQGTAEFGYSQTGALPQSLTGNSGGALSGTLGGTLGGSFPQAATEWAEDFNAPHWQGVAPPNLIHQHREELRQAATGRLDHMVIDVVSSLFDQVLSDPKVPPQMARLLARLQLPVLRAALGDPSFFSSRRHPVRRFINRMASLACAYEDFSEDPGRAFLSHVRDLVQDVANGDFDRMDVYEGKLDALEAFINEQVARALSEHTQASRVDAASLLARKETDLRLQQRYTQQMQSALAPVPMPDFIRDFLAQIWSQAIVLVMRDAGSSPERTQRIRQFGKDLVMSVQPKAGSAQRQAFLGQLPSLMKTLNEGLDLIAWPEPARKKFFALLLPAHAESLKGQALSALETNLLIKQLESVFGSAPPTEQDLGAEATSSLPQDLDLSERLSAAEAKSLGLISESGVNWTGEIDIDLSAEAPLQAVDISIEGLPEATEAPEPSEGELLIEHLQLGFAYQMYTGNKGEEAWHKVRLAHISAGRSFFIFTQGAKHQETVTMTARMLKRLCESKRMRAFENAYLMERAIARARKQLAALGTSKSN